MRPGRSSADKLMPRLPSSTQVRYSARLAAGTHSPTFPLLRFLPNGDPRWMVSSAADVCIEGYPRSGNSFVVRAFQQWNTEVRVAHHLHVPEQVKRAVRLGIPTAVLIRHPLDAIASLWVFFDGGVSIRRLVKSYISFYNSTMHLRHRVAVCQFDSVIADPRRVTALLNEKYGTSFQAGDWTVDSARKIQQAVADNHRTMRDGLESRLPLPSAAKCAAKAEVEPRILRSKEFDRAADIYTRFTRR